MTSPASICKLLYGKLQLNIEIAAKMSRLTFILLILISTSCARRSGGGSYGRYSGRGSHGSHSYPHSTGYSGTGSNTRYIGNYHSYPASTGLSGNQQNSQLHQNIQHTQNKNAGGDLYPASTGLSGHGQTQQNNQHTPNQYHPQNSQSGGHGYHSTKTEVHHHYHYSPPQQITYGSHSFPVYHGQPPVYVYEYRDSGSRFDTLLTGLALYNLGKMSASHSYHDHYNYNEYRGNPGEICKLGVKKMNGDYEETHIDCKLMSSFIWEAHNTPTDQSSKHIVTTSVVNSTVNSNGTVSSITNTTVIDALTVKGPSIEVKPGMECFLIRISRDTSILKKSVDCNVLQLYATKSLRSDSSKSVLAKNILIICYSLYLLF
ncbi:uncharacterized protein LOC113516227 [Galleria mellonella]|uniref:Uncharacterized protein LOC113516227 n=1 Tax=Galleria mellonella TaxID=7137 RepID=A0A6J3C185_GALME|nr:uncharacterized protein LOC113516227 [Galleria mellonella]